MENAVLIQSLRNRDSIIFDYLFHQYYSSLCVFAMQYINDKQAVEDLVQDFFFHLWIEAPSLKITGSLRSYFFTSIKNRCLDSIKHSEVEKKYRRFHLLCANENSSEHFILESELQAAIQKSWQKLPPRCREIFEMSRIKGHTNSDIASMLNLSKRTVELQISNAIRIFKAELAEYLPLSILALLLF